jgi:hypothetical protein
MQGLKPSTLRPNVCFGSKADICSSQADVREVPKADIARSAKAKEAANWAAK